MSKGLSKAAALALVWVFPLYALIPRFTLWGPLGTDDVIPAATLGLCAMALAAQAGRPPASRLELLDILKRLWQGVAGTPALLVLSIVALVASATSFMQASSIVAAGVAVLRTGGRLALYGIIIVAAGRLLDIPRRRQLLIWLTAIAVLEGVFGIAAYLGKMQGPWQTGMLAYPPELMPSGGRARVQGTFGGEVPLGESFLNRANFYSAYLAMALMALAAFWAERRRVWMAVVAGAAIVGGILVSYSRMSLVAAVVGFLVAAMLSRRWIGSTLALVAVSAVLIASAPLRDRFLQLGSDRFGQWTIACRVIASQPWLGTGDGRYIGVAVQHAEDVPVPIVRTPHNSVLYAAASYGVVAGVALVLLYGVLLVEAIRRVRRRATPLAITRLALVAAFVVHDLTNNLFFIPEVALMFWAVYAATNESEPANAGVGADR